MTLYLLSFFTFMTCLYLLDIRGKQRVTWQQGNMKGRSHIPVGRSNIFLLELITSTSCCNLCYSQRATLVSHKKNQTKPKPQPITNIIRTPAILQADSVFKHSKTLQHKLCNYGVCTSVTIKSWQIQSTECIINLRTRNVINLFRFDSLSLPSSKQHLKKQKQAKI